MMSSAASGTPGLSRSGPYISPVFWM
jgi:hypothetical protein